MDSHIISDHLTSAREMTQIPTDGDMLESFIKENEEVAKAMRRCDMYVWRIQELCDIVNEYMDSSLANFNSLIALHKCCNHARESQSLVFLVLQQFDEEEAQGIASNSDGVDGQRYAKTQETLAKLMGAGDPFPEDFLMTLNALRRRQISMFHTLKDIYMNLDKKMKGKGIEAFRNVLSAIISVPPMALGVCAGGMAEIAVPPVARVAEAGASSVKGLMKVPWRKVPDKGWGKAINTMQVGQFITISDLDNLELLASRLKFAFEEIVRMVDFVAKGVPEKLCVEEMLKLCVGQMRKSSEKTGVMLNDLEVHACLGLAKIRRGRALLQQMVREIPKRD